MRNHTTRTAAGLGAALSLLLLSACAADDGAAAGSPSSSAGTDEHGADEHEAPDATEVQASTPRVAVTYDGGVLVLDAMSLEPVGEVQLEGFTRLNPAGDERHLMVSTTGGFQALDLGTWAEAHGDHSHYWTAEPTLTDVRYDATEPGHVVVHEGRTALFDDGTGLVRVVDSEHVADADAAAREYTTPSAHHGVAVELTDDTLVVSEGTEDARTGIRVLDGDGEEIAASDECPGVHGEAVAADEAVVIGCEDGAVVYADGKITKVEAPDSYGRIGNQAGSEASPIVLGDYKTDKDAELERPTRVSLIDTRDGSLELVDLPSSYTFRSLARGDDGEALVLGTDGQVHVIDPESGELTKSVPVIDEWEEPVEWQEPRPAILTLDGSVYVTDPATDSIHAVDIETGEVWKSAELGVTPNELNGVSGGEPHTHEAH
ncbi:zinc metallochaperone AztD [Promicromonospora sp. NPDC050880]|uniref:zinc metallochaperone AztD n=1 Tax=unclassified Promicromonospora TaxID=2647929 RepID=UPI0037AD1835